jgi:hypothetical protein
MSEAHDPVRPTAVWTVRRAGRELTCFVQQLAIGGWDVSIQEGAREHVGRSFRDKYRLLDWIQEERQRLVAQGWEL